MREHPILFSAPMVRAILEGRKTQTRRVIKPQPARAPEMDSAAGVAEFYDADECVGSIRCPYGAVGDRLWVRETHLLDPPIDGSWPSAGDGFASIEDIPACYHNAEHVLYRADNNLSGAWHWRPAIHMPRWASRITLEITDVRVERVQDISEADARAEGVLWVPGHGEIEPADLEEGYSNYLNCRDGFQVLWDSINAKRGFGWNANPYVWALTFKRVEQSQ